MKRLGFAASCLFATLIAFGLPHTQASPAVGPYGSIWVHDGNQIGRLDLTSATTATFTALPELQFGTFSKDGNDRLTDIAWAPDFSSMYAVARYYHHEGLVLQGLSRFDPNTGLGVVLSDDNDIGQINFTIANGAGFVNGILYSAVDDNSELYSINTTTGLFSLVGNIAAGGVSYYGAGDIVSYNGNVYSLSLAVPSSAGVDNYLIRLNMSDPSNSTLMGMMGTGASMFTDGFGLAAVEGVGLYAIGNGKEVFWMDPTNPANLLAVTITGDTSAFDVFNGATGAAAVPEPSTIAILTISFGLCLLQRRRLLASRA